MKKHLFMIGLMACMAIMLFGAVSAATPEKFADNSVLTTQAHPAASGSTVVWSDKRNGLYQIYSKNLASSSKAKVVSSGPGNQNTPDIYGNKVVWADTRNGLSQIYVKDLSSSSGAKPILSSTTGQFNPRIYGNNVVWQQQSTVVDYNLATTDLLYAPATSTTKTTPDVYKNYVVYSQYNSGTNVNDIKMWDTIDNSVKTIASSKFFLGELASTFTVPRIYGDHVVYQGYGGGNLILSTPSYNFVNDYQISKGTTKSLGGSRTHGALNPAVQGSFAVWQVLTSSNNFDIMMKDLSKNNAAIKVTTNQYNQVLPTVGVSSSGIYVSYQDYRTGSTHPSIVWRNNDPYAPTIVSSVPSNGQKGFSVSKTLTITFSKTIQAGSAYKSINVLNLFTNKKVSITTSIKNNVLYIKTNSPRAANTIYIITIPAKSIKDLALNTLSKNRTITFRTRP